MQTTISPTAVVTYEALQQLLNNRFTAPCELLVASGCRFTYELTLEAVAYESPSRRLYWRGAVTYRDTTYRGVVELDTTNGALIVRNFGGYKEFHSTSLK